MTTVLVVDDNEKIVEVLGEYLESAGYHALKAFDGDTALMMAQDRRPDLALLDVMLPGIDGLDLTRKFEALSIPVILVTARGDEVDRLVGLELGADDYITKPFSPREVVARVKAVLRRTSSRADHDVETALSVGDLLIDPMRRQVEVAGEPIDLTRTEFDIVFTLAGQPGRVFTRLQLLEVASGDAFEGYERTVDAHIKNIRKKMGDTSKQPRYIKTVFGVGYKMEG